MKPSDSHFVIKSFVQRLWYYDDADMYMYSPNQCENNEQIMSEGFSAKY